MAMTEKQPALGPDEHFFEVKKDRPYDKYSEGNVVKEEQSDDYEELGFMDDEEIQPKRSASY